MRHAAGGGPMCSCSPMPRPDACPGRATLVAGLASVLRDTEWGTAPVGLRVRRFILDQLRCLGLNTLLSASPAIRALGLQARDADIAKLSLLTLLRCDDSGREDLYREAWRRANPSGHAGRGPAAGEGNAVLDAMILEGLSQLGRDYGGGHGG